MIKDPESVTRCLSLMVISKSLERIADHAKNVAEEVVYLCEARDIRHSGPQEPAPGVAGCHQTVTCLSHGRHCRSAAAVIPH